jgi:hypothetical protein
VSEALRDQYRIPLNSAHSFVVEVCDSTGRRAEHGFSIERNVIWDLLGDKEAVTQAVKFHLSASWLAEAITRLAELDRKAAG